MKTILAEKPSVAKDIAAFLKADSRKDGYFEGNGYRITWAFGHLAAIADPEQHGFSKEWTLESLPVIPSTYKIVPIGDAGAKKQFNTIKELFETASEIICATDAGREGELIFRNILECTKAKAPIQRLWVSSLTKEGLQKGFSNLRPSSEFDNLYKAAKARSCADWLLGMNLTRGFTKAKGQGKMISLGRVQTPTLALICARYIANKNFTKTKFYTPELSLTHSGVIFLARFEKNFPSLAEANAILKQITSNQIACSQTVTKEIRDNPPTLFDLTTLQREANKKYGFTADQTLNFIQKLYEDKHITYPRTDSSYLSDDMKSTVKDSLLAISNSYKEAKPLFENLLSDRVFDNDKVSDHHAIIPTKYIPTGLSGNDLKIYELIVERFLQALSDTCVKDKTELHFVKSAGLYKSTGIVIRIQGWRAIQITKAQSDEEQASEDLIELPPVKKDDLCEILMTYAKEGTTTAPPILNDASLLQQMETAGKLVESDTLTAEQKKFGIGTPATRANIIETLVKRQYITREGKKLIPTPFGLSIYELVKNNAIASAEQTGKWEFSLSQINDGTESYEYFMEKIGAFTREQFQIMTTTTGELESLSTELNPIKCPICKDGSLLERANFWGCSAYKSGCKFSISKEIAGKSITKAQIKKICEKGESDEIKGFKSKSDKSFDAKLKIVDEKVTFIFSSKA